MLSAVQGMSRQRWERFWYEAKEKVIAELGLAAGCGTQLEHHHEPVGAIG
jgi:hypothetical protein